MSMELAIQPEFELYETEFIKPKDHGCGAEIAEDTSYEECEKTVNAIANRITVHKGRTEQYYFMLGDIFCYMRDHFDQRYTQAINAGTLTEKTVDNIMRVCRKIPLDARHPGLTIWHHSVVEGIEDPKAREALLTEFEQDGLTVAEARTRQREKCPTKRQQAKPSKPKATGKAQDEPERPLQGVDHEERCLAAIRWIKSREDLMTFQNWPKAQIARWAQIWAEFRRMERRAGLGHGGGKK